MKADQAISRESYPMKMDRDEKSYPSMSVKMPKAPAHKVDDNVTVHVKGKVKRVEKHYDGKSYEMGIEMRQCDVDEPKSSPRVDKNEKSGY